VSITTAAETVRIIVADDGDGLDPDEFDRVFERFHRGDPSRTGDGHGLGLSIAQTIAQNHNGSISATNSQDGGAVFTVELPIG
jgi:signal transduction histidine kinase